MPVRHSLSNSTAKMADNRIPVMVSTSPVHRGTPSKSPLRHDCRLPPPSPTVPEEPTTWRTIPPGFRLQLRPWPGDAAVAAGQENRGSSPRGGRQHAACCRSGRLLSSSGVVVTQLSPRQIAELREVWADLQDEPGANQAAQTDDAVCRAWLDAWLAGVLSSYGQVTSASLDDLLAQRNEAEERPLARAYVERVVTCLMPGRDREGWRQGHADVMVQEHCREHGYQVSGAVTDRFGYQSWRIAVPGRVGLECNGELCLLTFPGGYTWPEFGHSSEGARQALEDQLRLLDAYAEPATRTVTRKRALRRSRTELRLSDGTVLWHGGGTRRR